MKCYKMVNERSRKKRFDSNTEILKHEYSDIFTSVKSDVRYTAQYDGNGDIGTT